MGEGKLTMNNLENILLILGSEHAPETVAELRDVLAEAAVATGALERDDFGDAFLVEVNRLLSAHA